MKNVRNILLVAAILLMTSVIVRPATGELDINLGYRNIDEDGNESVDQPSANLYDGVSVSMENMKYVFDNGLLLRSNFNNINLDSRNLMFDFSKPGLFGVNVKTNRYRRIYGADGDECTKRDLTSARVWVNPTKNIKLFADGSFNYISGETVDLFSTSFGLLPREVDYKRNKFTFGGRAKYQGRLFQGEYGTSKFTDDTRDGNDQTRTLYRVIGMTPMPEFEWLLLTGTYQQFINEYDDTDFRIKSWTFKGSALARLSGQFTFNYIALYNRVGSDSDFVETDNLAHNLYLTYLHSRKLGATIGYQNHVNDDYEDEVKSNAFFIECWGSPSDKLDLKASYGHRAEEVDEGSRLIGDEDRNRMKFMAKYKFAMSSTFKAQIESRRRKNDQLGSEAEFVMLSFEGMHDLPKYAQLIAGYSYSDGKYTNTGQTFEYKHHQLHAGIHSHEYNRITLGAMAIYYKSECDLDTEGSDLRFTGDYKFNSGVKIEFAYNVLNFDDFLYGDHYYTANIVELNIIKSFKF